MKYLITFSYDGSKYYGYQKQPSKKTIQKEIEDVLFQLNSNKEVIISASGRTDSGVHALNQKAHFVLDNNFEPEKLKYTMNKMLSSSIYIKKVEHVNNDFHARFNVKRKKYTYKINTGEYNPLEYDYILQYNKPLNIEDMKKAIKFFEGKHNFKSFTKIDEEKESYEREIFETSVDIKENIISITFVGSGFMRYMVRNMVGLLVEIGSSKRNYDCVMDILKKEDRKESGITIAANGLYLEDVYYE
jgi:tRNA pseudouridine38-40 synthase